MHHFCRARRWDWKGEEGGGKGLNGTQLRKSAKKWGKCAIKDIYLFIAYFHE